MKKIKIYEKRSPTHNNENNPGGGGVKIGVSEISLVQQVQTVPEIPRTGHW